MKFRRLLSFRLVFLLLVVMIVFFGLYTYINIHVHSSNLMENVLVAANRVSDVIKRSTHYSMLLNRRKDLYHIIQTTGNEPGIDGIRIYNKRGEIMFSTTSGEDGKTVDLHAEACYVCHAQEKPLEALPMKKRSRIFSSPQGHRVLGVINPIMNETLCYNADCHAHPATQQVLGVLDVKMSLKQLDERVAENRTWMILYAILLIAIVGIASTCFIFFMIHVPVKKLIVGTQQISSGNLDYEIDIQSHDEIGFLAKSFNRMTRDLTKAQSHLCQMAKMASIGQLSATIAHEINNPLAGIFTYSKLILKKFKKERLTSDEKKSIEKYLNFIKNETGRCGDIVKNLLFFSKGTGGDFCDESLNSIIDKSLQLIDHHLEIQGITLEKELSQGDDIIFCDPNQLEQAFIALFVNAVEAMPKGGALKVKTEYVTGGKTVRILISDTGYGIPEELRSNIFDPFFSTKKDEKGVGLGLSVVYGIIQRHFGVIQVESEVNKGTTFIISLPRQRTKEDLEQPQLIEKAVA